MLGTVQPVGDLLREWRQRRRMSQLDLALEAEISTRHLSFVESGRAQPSREMVLHLAERLDRLVSALDSVVLGMQSFGAGRALAARYYIFGRFYGKRGRFYRDGLAV